MTRISRPSSIEKRRIHTNYVQRNKTTIDRADSVEAVDPVKPVFNNIGYASANHLMYSDSLYDSLMELKKEYLRYYHHERNLQKAIDKIKEDRHIALENLETLINRYNKAIEALEDFDAQLRSNFSSKIKGIIEEYEKELLDIGISIVDRKTLGIDEMTFKEVLLKSRKDLDISLQPIRDMLLRLYRNFRNIKGPYKEGFDEIYPHIIPEDSSGIILNEES